MIFCSGFLIFYQIFFTFSPDQEESNQSQHMIRPSTSAKDMPNHIQDVRKKNERPTIWKTIEKGCGQREVRTCKDSLPQSDSIKTPLEYFRYFFDNDLMTHIVEQSNLFSVQNDPDRPLNLSNDELEQFLGTVLYTSIIHLPRARMYWASYSRVSLIADVFSRDRWEKIKQNIHFNDNSHIPPPDNTNKDTRRLFKIKPFIDMILPKFQVLPKSPMLSIDEQIVPYKGRSGLKQYNPSKPHKWGYKIFVLCGPDGLTYNFEIYSGKIQSVPGMADIGASGNIVLKLTQIIPRHKNYMLYFDNWFTSLKLLCTLSQIGIYSLGTIRSNRMGTCRMVSDNDLKKRGRGSYEEKEGTVDDTDIRIIKWSDNRAVHLASTFACAEPTSIKQRWDKSQKKYIEIQIPNAVGHYNKFMGGVDQLDAMIAYHRIKLRSQKFYIRIFYHMLDMICVNSYLLYHRDCNSLGLPSKKQHDLLAFKSIIAQGLISQGKDIVRKRGRPNILPTIDNAFNAKKRRGPTKAIPITDIRTDGIGHWPKVVEERQRCKKPNCACKTNVICRKCNVHLCLNKNNDCFTDFHTN